MAVFSKSKSATNKQPTIRLDRLRPTGVTCDRCGLGPGVFTHGDLRWAPGTKKVIYIYYLLVLHFLFIAVYYLLLLLLLLKFVLLLLLLLLYIYIISVYNCIYILYNHISSIIH